MKGNYKTIFVSSNGIFKIKEVNCGQLYALFIKGTFIDRFYRLSDAKKRMEEIKQIGRSGRAC